MHHIQVPPGDVGASPGADTERQWLSMRPEHTPRAHAHTRILFILVGLVLALALGAASGHAAARHHAPARAVHHRKHHEREHRRHRQHTRAYHRRHVAARDTRAQTLGALPGVIGVGDVPGCAQGGSPVAIMRQEDATVLRVFATPDNPYGAFPCARAAHAAGYRVHLVVQWWNPMSARQVAAWALPILHTYGHLPSAVSIGNEQELNQHGPGITGARYAAVWDMVEPDVATIDPHATRIAGEVSPWGLQFMQAALDAGLPGVQALAAHPYLLPGGAPASAFIDQAASVGLPCWFTEGLQGPDSWGPDVPLEGMRGAVRAYIWMA